MVLRLTVRHFYDFGEAAERVGRDLVRPEAWDVVRETPGPFELPAGRVEWEAKAYTPQLAARARDIAGVAARLGARSLCSYGVGNARLELNVARAAPGLRLVCTDFTPRTVARLRLLFSEAEVVEHDLRTDPPREAELQLMHRIDAELPADAWKAVFPRFREPVLLVPALLLTWVDAAREVARRVRKPRAARAGYFRNEDALRDLWAATHDDERLRVGELDAFLLTRR